MPCPKCGQVEGWTKTPVGMKDNIRVHGDMKECKKCGHTWSTIDEPKKVSV